MLKKRFRFRVHIASCSKEGLSSHSVNCWKTCFVHCLKSPSSRREISEDKKKRKNSFLHRDKRCLYDLMYSISGFDSVDDESHIEPTIDWPVDPYSWNVETEVFVLCLLRFIDVFLHPHPWFFSLHMKCGCTTSRQTCLRSMRCERNAFWLLILFVLMLERLDLHLIPRMKICACFSGVLLTRRKIRCAFLLADSIVHGLTLCQTPSLNYCFYLCQIGVCMSVLAENSLYVKIRDSPFFDYFKQGLVVTLR
jgi:hypothetical protein